MSRGLTGPASHAPRNCQQSGGGHTPACKITFASNFQDPARGHTSVKQSLKIASNSAVQSGGGHTPVCTNAFASNCQNPARGHTPVKQSLKIASNSAVHPGTAVHPGSASGDTPRFLNSPLLAIAKGSGGEHTPVANHSKIASKDAIETPPILDGVGACNETRRCWPWKAKPKNLPARGSHQFN